MFPGSDLLDQVRIGLLKGLRMVRAYGDNLLEGFRLTAFEETNYRLALAYRFEVESPVNP